MFHVSVSLHARNRFYERFYGLNLEEELESSLPCGVQLGDDVYRLSKNKAIFVCCDNCVTTCLTVDQANHNLQKFKSRVPLYISVEGKRDEEESDYELSEILQGLIKQKFQEAGKSLQVLKEELEDQGFVLSEETRKGMNRFYQSLVVDEQRKRNPPKWLRNSA